VLGEGQLLLVTVAIGSPPIGLLLVSGGRRVRKVVTGGLALVGILCASAFYADAASGRSGTSPHKVAEASLVLFGLVLIVGTVCIILASDEP
jgi:hypothetical protein